MRMAWVAEPPFNFRDGSGLVTGCDVELAREAMRLAGQPEPEMIETEFAELLPGLSDGRWDMTTGLFITAERERAARFSRPVWALSDGLLVRRGNPLGLTGYASVAQHPSARIVAIRDQVQHGAAIAAGVPAERIAVFGTYAEAATAVAEGRADAYASVFRAHVGYLAGKPDLPLEAVPVPADESPPATGGFAFPLKDDACAKINAALGRLLGRPEHRAILSRFGFASAEIDLIARLCR